MNKNKSNKSTKSIKKVKNNKKDINNNVYPDGYIRPKVTASEMLSADDIKKRMKNFEKIDVSELNNLVDGDKVRYFEISKHLNFKKNSL